MPFKESMQRKIETGIYEYLGKSTTPFLATFGKRGKAYFATLDEAKQFRNEYIENRDFNKSKPIDSIAVHALMTKVITAVLKKARRRLRMKNLDDDKKRLRRERNYKWSKNNKEKQSEAQKNWNSKNKQRVRDMENKRNKRRRQNDTAFVIKRRIRSRLIGYRNEKGAQKSGSTFKQMKCTPEELSNYLNSQLRDGEVISCMALDHVFPMSSYDICNMDEQTKMMHYTNLQPLSHFENLNKKAKLPTKEMASKVNPDCWPPGVTMDMLPDIYPGWATPLRMHADGKEGASSSSFDAGSSADHAMMEEEEYSTDESEDSDSDSESN